MFKTYLRILHATRQTFGIGKIFLTLAFFLPVFFVFTRFTLFLDRIFFPAYRQVKIEHPVFILGGRGGTTFLQKLMTKPGDFAAFEAWHILFPSLTARRLVKPIIDYLVKTDRATIAPPEDGHEIKLNGIEEDEFLFLHQLDTQFVTLFTPLAFDELEHPELQFYDLQPQKQRQKSIELFKGFLKRQILFTKKAQVLSKFTYSVYRIKTLMEAFPDGKFIVLLRSPQLVIPSYFSLHYNLLDRQWGLENIPKDKLQEFFRRIYKHSIELYRYPIELIEKGEVDTSRLMILDTDLLFSDLGNTFERIVNFTGIEPSEQLKQAIARQVEKQKNYQRKHEVLDIEKFGVTSEQIDRDFAFLGRAYELADLL